VGGGRGGGIRGWERERGEGGGGGGGEGEIERERERERVEGGGGVKRERLASDFASISGRALAVHWGKPPNTHLSYPINKRVCERESVWQWPIFECNLGFQLTLLTELWRATGVPR